MKRKASAAICPLVREGYPRWPESRPEPPPNRLDALAPSASVVILLVWIFIFLVLMLFALSGGSPW